MAALRSPVSIARRKLQHPESRGRACPRRESDSSWRRGLDIACFAQGRRDSQKAARSVEERAAVGARNDWLELDVHLKLNFVVRIKGCDASNTRGATAKEVIVEIPIQPACGLDDHCIRHLVG